MSEPMLQVMTNPYAGGRATGVGPANERPKSRDPHEDTMW